MIADDAADAADGGTNRTTSATSADVPVNDSTAGGADRTDRANRNGCSPPAVRLCHLYPREMNIYADRGNIAVLARRLAWRGFELQVTEAGPGVKIRDGEADIYYLGGGQDRDQQRVAQDLLETKAAAVKAAVADGAVGLFVCGGYQLAGREYRSADGCVMEGMGVLDVTTEAGASRLVGNVEIESRLGGETIRIVGYENHAGRSRLGPEASPLGRVIKGHGNNGRDRTEGAFVEKFFGTYLHGPLLPKNPQLADILIRWALEFRYGERFELEPLDDRIEEAAREAAISLSKRRRRTRSPRPISRLLG